MPGPHPAVAATRRAVRGELAGLPAGALVLVACSGGVDSLALATAAAVEAPHQHLRAGAVIVDHGLQAGSAAVAAEAKKTCAAMGLDPVMVIPVVIEAGSDGPEALARAARYRALSSAAEQVGAGRVLLGHTRDDQAEQVLLGLARGSGARSLSGMPPRRGIFARPLLGVTRADTEATCTAYGLTPWRDPHNQDEAYARVRARRALTVLEETLGPGIVAALARSARHLRDDADLIDELTERALVDLGPGPYAASALAALPRSLRTRVLRSLATAAGARAGAVTTAHVDALDALVTCWRGQGPVDLPGSVRARRVHGCLSFDPQ